MLIDAARSLADFARLSRSSTPRLRSRSVSARISSPARSVTVLWGLRHGIDRGDAFPSSTIYDGAFTVNLAIETMWASGWVQSSTPARHCRLPASRARLEGLGALGLCMPRRAADLSIRIEKVETCTNNSKLGKSFDLSRRALSAVQT